MLLQQRKSSLKITVNTSMLKKIITVIYSVAVWRKLNILQLGRHVLDTSIFIVSIISPNQ